MTARPPPAWFSNTPPSPKSSPVLNNLCIGRSISFGDGGEDSRGSHPPGLADERGPLRLRPRRWAGWRDGNCLDCSGNVTDDRRDGIEDGIESDRGDMGISGTGLWYASPMPILASRSSDCLTPSPPLAEGVDRVGMHTVASPSTNRCSVSSASSA